jgi:hypothetical protein
MCAAFQPSVIQAAECLAGEGGDPVEIAFALIEALSTTLPSLMP